MDEDKIPPLLSGLKKNREAQLGKVPDGYFENFEAKLMHNIALSDKEKKIRYIKPAYIMPIAASLLLLVIAALWFFRSEKPLDYPRLMAMNIDEKLQGLESGEVNEYLISEIDNIETDDLLEQIDTENISFISSEHAEILPVDSAITPKLQQNGSEIKNKTTENPEKEELLYNVADESDLDELLLELDDEEFKALEQSLLKAKKKPN